jgi:hypothetical protein
MEMARRLVFLETKQAPETIDPVRLESYRGKRFGADKKLQLIGFAAIDMMP